MDSLRPPLRKLVHVERIPIRWGDMDAMGHVNNTVYFRYMEQARIGWFDALVPEEEAWKSTGIVIANAKAGPTYNFKLDQVYRGVAAELPSPTGFAKNTYKNWKEVDASLPAQAILVYGPPPTSGTRDAFVELGLEKGAQGAGRISEIQLEVILVII
jgi:hypothetical protein